MCCNTAHYAIEEIERKSGVPFINLISEMAYEIKRREIKRFELFCSDGCARFKIYDRIFSKICPQVKIVYPTEERQKLVTQVICSVKNKNRLQEGATNPQVILNKLIKTATEPVF